MQPQTVLALILATLANAAPAPAPAADGTDAVKHPRWDFDWSPPSNLGPPYTSNPPECVALGGTMGCVAGQQYCFYDTHDPADYFGMKALKTRCY